MIKLNLQSRLLLTIFIPLTFLFLILSWVNYNSTYDQLLEQKRQATKNYIAIAEGTYQKNYQDFLDNKISEDEAKLRVHHALTEIRYGDDGKDYYWVNDTRPWMITHANKKLEGTDLSSFQDKIGQFIFKEFAKIALEKPEGGFFTYMWPSKENPNEIVPKLSYVKLFKPWGHVVGTRIYIQDVKAEAISTMSKSMAIMVIVFTLIFAFVFYFIKYKIINQLLSIISSLQDNGHNVTTSSKDIAALSSKSANEIESILGQSIQKVERIIAEAKNKVSVQSKDSNEKLSQSVQITHDMVTIFNRIIQAVEQVNIAMKEVNGATQEQSQGISEINRAMMDFDQSTQMNNSTANKTAGMAEILHGQSDDLQKIMEKLKLMVFG